jgi:hypothetical protein
VSAKPATRTKGDGIDFDFVSLVVGGGGQIVGPDGDSRAEAIVMPAKTLASSVKPSVEPSAYADSEPNRRRPILQLLPRF